MNAERVPPVEINESFVYLGNVFNFGNCFEKIKTELLTLVQFYITTIDKLPLKSVSKISIIQRYVYSKLRWKFSIYDLVETWVAQNLDSMIAKFVRKWCQLPVSANMQHLEFDSKHLGIDFKFAKTIYLQCQMTVRRMLARSRNMEIHKLYALTSPKHVPLDSIINEVISTCNESSTEKQIKSRIDGKQRKVLLN